MANSVSEAEIVPPSGDNKQSQTGVTPRRTRRQRRLVSKGVYVRTVGKKVGLFSLSGFLLSSGLVLSLLTLIGLYFGLLLLVLCFGVLAAVAFWYSTRSFVRAREIEPVRPVTNRTTHLLPPEESLVRASEAPSSHQPTELLRAAPSHHETPSEELLRATHRDQPEG